MVQFANSMRALDRTAMAKKYKGKWVALRADRKTVIGSGSTAKQVMAIARKKGVDTPIITRMPRVIRPFIGA